MGNYSISYTTATALYDKEATFLKHATAFLRSLVRHNKIYTFRVNDMSHSGYSDLFILLDGVFVVAELKDKDGKPSEHQLKFIKDVESAGGIGGVCYSLQDIINLLNRTGRIKL